MNIFKKVTVVIAFGLSFASHVRAMEDMEVFQLSKLPVLGADLSINEMLAKAVEKRQYFEIGNLINWGANLGTVSPASLKSLAEVFPDFSWNSIKDKEEVQKFLVKNACIKGDLLNVWLLLSLTPDLIFILDKTSLDSLMARNLLQYKYVYTYYEHSEDRYVLMNDEPIGFQVSYTFGISNWDSWDKNWFNNALFEAARRNDVVFAHWCVLNGADVNYAQTDLDKEGKTPFHEAAAYGCLAMLEYLKVSGADINAVTDPVRRWTPLHAAYYWERFEAVEWLEANGANTTIQNSYGKIPSQVLER